MKGIIESDGTVTITFNIQWERLDAPYGLQYLPCEECGKIVTRDKNVVSTMCNLCYEWFNVNEGV